MRNNTRRNRNIGTAKQGHGQNNRMEIPDPYLFEDGLHFTERLTRYEKSTQTINGHEFTFVVEAPRAGCYHPCTKEDVAAMLAHIPVADYGDLHLIVFRQPKRKEEMLCPVWARLRYEYRFEGKDQPAIVLEAWKTTHDLKRSRKLVVDAQREFERLQADGHTFTADKRSYTARLTAENARATQLYRSLPHEFGHYVQYVQIVKKPEHLEGTQEERDHYYFNSISSDEKEKFAHAYADRLLADLKAKGVVPFAAL